MSNRCFLHFATALGDRLAAIEDVDCVVPMMQLDRVAGEGGPTCLGLMDLRGEIVPVFDLVAHGTDAAASSDGLLIVLQGDGARVAVFAAAVHGVITVPAAQCTVWAVPGSPAIRSANVAGQIIRILHPHGVHA